MEATGRNPAAHIYEIFMPWPGTFICRSYSVPYANDTGMFVLPSGKGEGRYALLSVREWRRSIAACPQTFGVPRISRASDRRL